MLMAVVLAAVAPVDVFARTPGFSDETRVRGPFREAWIAALPDELRLSEMSVPGTHASGARRAGEPFGDYGVTQAMSLTDQLRLGIRAFDLPLRLGADGGLAVHQGPTPQNLPLANALRQIQAFLARHGREAVFLRVRHRPSVGAFDPYRDPGPDALRAALARYRDDPRFAGLFWVADVPDADPNLAAIRGRIVLLDALTPSSGPAGLAHRAIGPAQAVLGDGSAETLAAHWREREAALADPPGPGGPLSVTSLAASGLDRDWTARDVWTVMRAIRAGEAPAPPTPRAIARAINAQATAAIGTSLGGPLGIVLVDFPSAELVTRIVALNKAFDWGVAGPRALIDVDGDARADYCRTVARDAGAGLACTLLGARGFAATLAVALDPRAGAYQGFADVTGDGRADFCRLPDGANPAWLECHGALGDGGRRGLRPALSGLWLDREALAVAGPVHWLADVTGDGRADFCALGREDGQGALVCWAMGQAGGQAGRAALGASTPLDPGRPGNRWFADVNGDGKADFCRVLGRKPAGYLRCEISDGARFPAAVSAHIRMGHAQGFYRFRGFADVNGDGRADFCRVVGRPPRPKLSCALSDGRQIKDAFYQPIDIGDPSFRFLADTNADGVAEYCRRLGDGIQDFACHDFHRGGVPRETFHLHRAR